MQPWENERLWEREKTRKNQECKKEKRSFSEKLGLVSNAITLSASLLGFMLIPGLAHSMACLTHKITLIMLGKTI